MKEELKNKMTHEVEILGRTVSVLALVGLLVMGGASATLLSTFGTTSATVDVDEQAVSLTEEPDVTLSGQAAPENKWVSTTAVNNNPNETIYFDWEIDEDTSSVTNTAAFSSVVVDVEDKFTTGTDTTSGSNLTTEVGYNTSEDELTFEVPSVDNYGSQEGVTMYFDTNGDGNYNFQVDTAASGAAGDVWKWNAEDQQWDGVHDWTQDPVEYQGISHKSATDPNTDLSELENVTITVDADKFDRQFRVAASHYGSTVDGKSSGDSSNYALVNFPEVNGTEVALNGGSERDYALVVGANSGADSSDNYTATAKAKPVTK
jgi:hypothetical protein